MGEFQVVDILQNLPYYYIIGVKEQQEEKKEEAKVEEKKEEPVEEKKEEEKKEEEVNPDVVLKVDMHCEACARKVQKALQKCEGVKEVKADSKSRTVVVKGEGVDPAKICERVVKKTGKKVELISPLPKPPEEDKKEEAPVEPAEEKKPEIVTVVLKVRMHCEACAQVLHKRIKKIEGVESVEIDLANSQVIVKGLVDPNQLVEHVYRKTRRQASIVQEEDKKEEEVAKKEENVEGETKEGETNGEGDNKIDAKKYEYVPIRYLVEYAYTPQIFSDENPNACSIM